MNWELHFWCAKHPLYKQLRDLKSLSLGQPVPDVLVGVARVSGKTVEQLNLGRWGNRSFRVEHSESDTRSLLIAQGLGTLAMLPENSPEAPLPFPIVAIGVGFVSLLLWPYSPMSHAPFWARRWRAGGSQERWLEELSCALLFPGRILYQNDENGWSKRSPTCHGLHVLLDPSPALSLLISSQLKMLASLNNQDSLISKVESTHLSLSIIVFVVLNFF